MTLYETELRDMMGSLQDALIVYEQRGNNGRMPKDVSDDICKHLANARLMLTRASLDISKADAIINKHKEESEVTV